MASFSFDRAGKKAALTRSPALAHSMLCNETGARFAPLKQWALHCWHSKVEPLPCELSLQLTLLRRWADGVLEEGALVDEFELPAVQLRSEPAATALAAAQAARASKEADAQRLGGALQRARQKDETIGPFLGCV